MDTATVALWISIASGAGSLISTWVAVVALRRSGQRAKRELRIQLRHADNELRHHIEQLPRILDDAKVARQSATAAMGAAMSGVALRQQQEDEERRKRFSALKDAAPETCANHSGLGTRELEDSLVARRDAIGRAQALRDECDRAQEGARQDLERRDRLRPRFPLG